jgi:hypothetical protein
MKRCPNCKNLGSHKTTDSRVIDGVRYRKKKCSCGKISVSKEIRVKGWPVKPPAEKLPTPKLHFNGITVNRNSPDWLKRVAMLLDE